MFNLGKSANKAQPKPSGGKKKMESLRVQNSMAKTPPPATNSEVSGDKQADAAVHVEEKRQKKVIRRNALYSDQAIALAKGRK